jgi:Glycosyl hydrolases family 38 N-terminal domain
LIALRGCCLIAAVSILRLAAQEQSRYELPAAERTGTIRQIWVVSHSHLDIGFTRPPDEVARDYKDNIDHAIRLAREHSDFRWTIESTWMLEQWLARTEDQEQIARLAELMKAGRITLGAAFANMHSGLMAAEESNRLVYPGEKFRRRFGIEAAVAFQNDVPGFTWAYPRILAGSGVKFLVTGLNLFIGGGNSLGMARDPFYWTGPDGSRVLTWFAYDSYVEGYRWHLRGGPQIEELEKSVPRRLAWLEKNGYKYDTYLLMASAGDNTDPANAYRILERIRAWNAKHPDLPMKMCNAEEFFAYLLKKYGDNFASAPGDATGHWEIVKLRAPEAAAKMRHVSNELPAIEMAATAASLLHGWTFPRVDFAEAWHSLLVFHEHTADAGAGWPGYFSRQDTDWNNIAHYAAAMNGYSATEQLARKTLEAIGGGAGKSRLLVFNGLSWQRGGVVRVEKMPPELRDGPLRIVDLQTNQPVAYEDVPGTHRQIVFFARDVPAAGYRMYSIAKGDAGSAPGSFPIDVSVDAVGRITSILETNSRRQLIDTASARPFGSILLSRGRGGFQAPAGGQAEVKTNEGPVQKTVAIAGKDSPLAMTTITTYRGADYADLQFDVNLDFDLASNQSRQFAIALPCPKGEQMFVDGAGFVMRVPQDILPGGGAARYTPVHFTHLRQSSDWGVTLANRDSAFVTPDFLYQVANEGRRAQTREEGVQQLFRTEPRSSPVQSFRFRIAAQPERNWEWEHLGAELNLPLQAVFTEAGQSESFLQVNRPEVRVLAFKPAEFQPGWYVLRFQEVSGNEIGNIRFSTRFQIADARQASTVERPGAGIDLANFKLSPWQTLTVLVRIK